MRRDAHRLRIAVVPQMRIIYIPSPIRHGRPDHHEMPDVEVHRGEPLGALLRELNAPRERRTRFNGRAAFLGITIGLHAVVAIALVRIQITQRFQEQPPPIEASLLEAPTDSEPPPPAVTPPPMNIVYSLPTPQEITIETETISEMPGTAITSSGPVTSVAPPMVESVEYVRAEPPALRRNRSASANTARSCCACWSMHKAARRRSRSSAPADSSAWTRRLARPWRNSCSVLTK